MEILFGLKGGPKEITKWLAERFEAAIPGGKEQDTSNHYLFEESWIQAQKFNWEQSITVSANRKFDQFCLINSPKNPSHTNGNGVYVNGPAFKAKNTDDHNHNHNQEAQDVPYFAKLPNGAMISHTRNAIIKNELFYTVEELGVTKTVCLRIDKSESNQRVKQFYIDLQGQSSQYDCWLQYKKVFGGNQNFLDICQTLSVQHEDGYALLQTRVPTEFIGQIPTAF